MPRVTNTKKQRATQLLERLARGPAMRSVIGPLSDTAVAEAAQASYQLWVKTWVLPEVRELVPELRNSKT